MDNLNMEAKVSILRKSYSLKNLATLLDVNYQCIRLWVKGTTSPDSKNVKKINSLFDHIVGDVHCEDCSLGYFSDSSGGFRCCQGCQAGTYSRQVNRDDSPCKYFNLDKGVAR